MNKLFSFIESDDPQLEDDMYELKSDNNIHVQVNNGIYLVNKWHEKEGYLEFIDQFKSLKNAMKKALVINEAL